jgi:hypothetical protein
VVKRTLAWFARFRRLAVGYKRRADIFEAFHRLAVALIRRSFTERWFCQLDAPYGGRSRLGDTQCSGLPGAFGRRLRPCLGCEHAGGGWNHRGGRPP